MNRMGTRKRKRMKGGAPRVAVLFSGRIKAYEHVVEKLKALQDKYSATFFCSLNKKNMSPYIQKFCDTFGLGPEQMHLEPTVVPEWMGAMEVHSFANRENVYSILYHFKRAFDLLEAYKTKHGKGFDIVLQYRADIHPPETIQFISPEKNTVYIPNWGGLAHPEGFDRRYGVHASVTYGEYESMKTYCDAVNSIQELYDKYNVIIAHEALVSMHLVLKGITIERINHSFGMLPQRHEPNPEYDDIE